MDGLVLRISRAYIQTLFGLGLGLGGPGLGCMGVLEQTNLWGPYYQ